LCENNHLPKLIVQLLKLRYEMKYLIFLFFTINALILRGQETKQLTLPQVVQMAKAQSIAARQATTKKETSYWEYRTFQSNYKPQLTLNSNLPAFTRTFSEIIQPDGSILFQPVRNNNSSMGLEISQNITQTGGLLYATSRLQRFDDFDRKNKLYNGTLFAVGLYQPLFRFNPLKWDKKIEPLKYNESQQEYLESLENIALDANKYFFDLLLAQVNLQIADTNLSNTENILRIAHEKFELGKNSRNEILQLKLENLKARKAVATAKRDMEVASLNLKSFVGLQGSEKVEMIAPPAPKGGENARDKQIASFLAMTAEKAIKEAFENRSDAIAFSRRLLEAERIVAKAKGDNGVNATLTGNLGFSNRGQKIGDVFRTPQNYQFLQIEFTVPVLDWGRSQSRTKTAEANRQLTQYTIEQDKQNFEQAIYTQVTLFDMLKNQMDLTMQADSIASEKYQIAQDRYVLGNLSITDLSIAFSEKDQAKRDFIETLRQYWAAFYRLRWLTLYDFEKGEKIK
jgi:outer membrane protein